MTASPRWMTVKMAAQLFAVSERTVWRWVSQAHEAQVPRQRIRLEDSRGRAVKQLVVDVNALQVFEEALH